MVNSLLRVRWAALGAAVAVSLGGGVVWVANASGAGTSSSYVPIVPCRLADTRPETNVGTRSTQIVAGESAIFQVTGSNGGCNIPASATGIASNVTAANPTATSFLAVFPADAAFPNVSNLNWAAMGPPVPNQVTVALSAGGAIKAFNHSGGVDVIIDIVGYYVPSNSGPQGPAGLTGAQGAAGAAGTNGTPGVAGANGTPGTAGTNGLAGAPGVTGANGTPGAAGTNGLAGAPGVAGANGTPGVAGTNGVDGTNGTNGARGFSAWDTIPTGVTVTGTITYDSHLSGNAWNDIVTVDLPGVAPVALTLADVNFDANSGALDADATCTGTAAAPTAPPGKVCIYLDSFDNVDIANTSAEQGLLDTRSISIAITPSLLVPIGPGPDYGDEYLFASWAYTAP